MKDQSYFKRITRSRGMGQVLTVAVGLIMLCIAFGILNPSFFSERNVLNLLRQITPIFIIGIAQSYVLITGNIDLSIGSVLGMSSMVSATLMATYGVNPWVAAGIAMVCCLIIGAINALLVSNFKLPPFIATLGTMTIARGIAQLINNNYNTDSINKLVDAKLFQDILYYGNPLYLYNGIWIAVILFIIFSFYLGKTRSGRHIYAVGSNIEAARLSGVNINLTIMKAYLISAFCSGIAGLITCATTGMGSMDAGTGYELYAVAASVIGGVSTLGGQGILLGTVVGASIWGVLQNGLQFAGASVGWRNIVIGIIVVVSVLLDVIVRTGRKTKKVDVNRRMV